MIDNKKRFKQSNTESNTETISRSVMSIDVEAAADFCLFLDSETVFAQILYCKC